MKMADDCVDVLLRGKELSDSDVESLRASLCLKKVKDLRKIANEVSVRLTGSVRKNDIVDRLIGMAKIGATHKPIDDGDDDCETLAISYITEDVKRVLRRLPGFSSVVDWEKRLVGVLKDFTFMNLLIYLVYGRDKSFDMQSLKAFKSLKAYKYFFDGYVRNVWVYQCPCDNELMLKVLYFRAYVHHSYNCDAPLEVFVSMNAENGDVYSAKCSCVSGLGQACNHVAALLFYIEHHAHNNELPTEISRTSLPMKWNQPPKKTVVPDRATNMNFVKPSHGDDPDAESSKRLSRSTFDPRCAEHQVLDKESLSTLLSQVQKSVPNTGLQQFWLSNCPDSTINSEMLWHHVIFSHMHASTLMQENFFNPTLAQCYDYLSHMKLLQDEVAMIEEATQGQSDNELWFAIRNGRLTSSKFGEILHRRESTDPRRLVRDIMGYAPPMKRLPPQIRWGLENEDKARRCYIENRRVAGETMIVKQSGLHLMPEKAFLGASSDGLVTCTSVDTCCLGCLEIKCPYSIDKFVTVEMTPTAIADKFGDKFFLKKGEDGGLHLPQEHHYYAQVQGELAVIGREWCDFVVYSNGEVIVDRILADLDYWDTLEQKLEEFYVHNVIPEILSGKIFQEEYGSLI